MKTIIDTNYILRWFLNDIPSQALLVDELIKGSKSETIIVDRLTIAELTYVLRSQGYDHQQIGTLVEELFYYPSLVPLSLSEQVALKVYKNTNLDFEDCILLALAKVKNYKLGTFDKEMLKASKKK